MELLIIVLPSFRNLTQAQWLNTLLLLLNSILLNYEHEHLSLCSVDNWYVTYAQVVPCYIELLSESMS